MTPAQCRAARGLIRWTRPDLANASGVNDATVRRFENEQAMPQPASMQAMRRSLEAASVIFIDENGEGPGVRMRKEVNPSAARREAKIIASGREARGKAETAVDDALATIDAPHDEKAMRKLKLTRVARELKGNETPKAK